MSAPSAPPPLALQARGIFKDYGAIRVLQDVAIDVATGTTHAVIGPNGAGKTTLFKVLSGELLDYAGSVVFENRNVNRLSATARVRCGMGRTFQVARVFGDNTVLENMLVALESRTSANPHATPSFRTWRGALQIGHPPTLRSEAHGLLEQVELEKRAHVRAGTLAYGERKRLELGMMLALKPRLLLLDEPMAGMSSGDRKAAATLLARLARELALSIVLTEHDMNVVFALADHVTVLNYGRVIASGTPMDVKAHPMVRDVYLGR